MDSTTKEVAEQLRGEVVKRLRLMESMNASDEIDRDLDTVLWDTVNLCEALAEQLKTGEFPRDAETEAFRDAGTLTRILQRLATAPHPNEVSNSLRYVSQALDDVVEEEAGDDVEPEKRDDDDASDPSDLSDQDTKGPLYHSEYLPAPPLDSREDAARYVRDELSDWFYWACAETEQGRKPSGQILCDLSSHARAVGELLLTGKRPNFSDFPRERLPDLFEGVAAAVERQKGADGYAHLFVSALRRAMARLGEAERGEAA